MYVISAETECAPIVWFTAEKWAVSTEMETIYCMAFYRLYVSAEHFHKFEAGRID